MPGCFIYKLCRHFSIHRPRDQPRLPPTPWCCQGWVLWCRGDEGSGLLGISQLVQHQTDAALWWLEQPIPAARSRATICSSNPFLHGWAGSTGSCCGCFSLWTWEQGRCKLHFRHKNSQHLLQSGWAGPGWDPCQPWLARQRGLVRISLPLTGGAAWPDPWHGCSLGSARLIKHPGCVTLWSQVFLSPQPHALLGFFPPLPVLNQIYSLIVFDQGRAV